MSMFQFHSAIILEAASVAAGLITLHRASKETAAGYLKAAAAIFIAVGLLSAACTMFYGIKYFVQGDFDRLAPAAPRCMENACPMMHHGMMEGGMMNPGMMDGGKMDHGMPMGGGEAPSGDGSAPSSSAAPASAAPASAAHDAHHPGGKS